MAKTEPRAPAEVSPAVRRAFAERPPGRLLGRGHPVGDFLEAQRGPPTWI